MIRPNHRDLVRQKQCTTHPFPATILNVQQEHEHTGNDGRSEPVVDPVMQDVRDDIRDEEDDHYRTRDQMCQQERRSTRVQTVHEQQNEYQPDRGAGHAAVFAEKAKERE